MKLKILNSCGKKGLISLLFFLIASIASATTYYCSSSEGDDNNDGLSSSTPFKTLSKCLSVMADNDTFKFKRGDVFRGYIYTYNKTGVILEDYGTGDKPIFQNSIEANSGWSLYSGNIYQYSTGTTYDIGNIILSNSDVGIKCEDLTSLDNEKEFYSLSSSGVLYLYGNPSQYNDIELCIGYHVLQIITSDNITVRNIKIQYGGSHGIQINNSYNIYIYNCKVEYCGGAYLDGYGNIRYGNGIECWADCHDIQIHNCLIKQCYDEGITAQGESSFGTAYNIYGWNNIIDRCYLGMSMDANNVSFYNNTILNSLGCWSNNQRTTSSYSRGFYCNPMGNMILDFLNNIIQNDYEGNYYSIIVDNVTDTSSMNLHNNCWYEKDGFSAKWLGTTYNSFDEFKNSINKCNNSWYDKNIIDGRYMAEGACLNNGENIWLNYDYYYTNRTMNDIGAVESTKEISAIGLDFSNTDSLIIKRG